MKTPLLPLLCLASVLFVSVEAGAQTQVQVQPGDIVDIRGTGHSYSGFQIDIKLAGGPVADAKSLRAIVKTAMDDTGLNLVDLEKTKKSFEAPDNHGGTGAVLTLKLKSPSRRAAMIRQLSGEIDLYVPKNDPDSIVKVENFQKSGGRKIVSPLLAAGGIEVIAYNKEQMDAAKAKTDSEFGSVFAPTGPNDITVQIKDPGMKLVDIEFQDAGGNKIKETGWSSSGNEGEVMKTFSFSLKLPDDARMVIYLSTFKSLVSVPFTLTNITLP